MLLSSMYLRVLLLLCASFNPACVSTAIMGSGVRTSSVMHERVAHPYIEDVRIATADSLYMHSLQ